MCLACRSRVGVTTTMLTMVDGLSTNAHCHLCFHEGSPADLGGISSSVSSEGAQISVPDRYAALPDPEATTQHLRVARRAGRSGSPGLWSDSSAGAPLERNGALSRGVLASSLSTSAKADAAAVTAAVAMTAAHGSPSGLGRSAFVVHLSELLWSLTAIVHRLLEKRLPNFAIAAMDSGASLRDVVGVPRSTGASVSSIAGFGEPDTSRAHSSALGLGPLLHDLDLLDLGGKKRLELKRRRDEEEVEGLDGVLARVLVAAADTVKKMLSKRVGPFRAAEPGDPDGEGRSFRCAAMRRALIQVCRNEPEIVYKFLEAALSEHSVDVRLLPPSQHAEAKPVFAGNVANKVCFHCGHPRSQSQTVCTCHVCHQMFCHNHCRFSHTCVGPGAAALGAAMLVYIKDADLIHMMKGKSRKKSHSVPRELDGDATGVLITQVAVETGTGRDRG